MRGGNIMDKKLIVKPDKNGKLFITLYGTKYEIIVNTEVENGEKRQLRKTKAKSKEL